MNISVNILQHATNFLLREAEPRVFSSVAFLHFPPPAVPGETGLKRALPALLTTPAAAQGPRPCRNVIPRRKRSPRRAPPQEGCPSRGLCREVRPVPARQPKACLHLTPRQPRRLPQTRGGKGGGGGGAPGARARWQRGRARPPPPPALREASSRLPDPPHPPSFKPPPALSRETLWPSPFLSAGGGAGGTAGTAAGRGPWAARRRGTAMARKRKASPRPAADSKRRSGGLGARRGEPEEQEEEEGECGREGSRAGRCAIAGAWGRSRPLVFRRGRGAAGVSWLLAQRWAATAPVRERAVTSGWRRG